MPDLVVDASGPWPVYWLRATHVEVAVVPALGGRVLALRSAAGEHLFRNPDLLTAQLRPAGTLLAAPSGTNLGSWRNWGGEKTWPAPQGWSAPHEWAGPPDPVLDGGPYTPCAETGDEQVAVTLTSPPDPRSGLQVTRHIQLRDDIAGYCVELGFRNVTDHPVTWAIWDVVQLPAAAAGDTEAGVWLGVDPAVATAWTAMISGTGTPHARRAEPGVVHVPSQDVVGKLGFPSASGWLAHVTDARLTVLRYAVDHRASYPDDGARAAVWLEYPLAAPLPTLGELQPRHRVIECEALGPLRTLPPGGTSTLTVHVLAGVAIGPVHAVTATAAVGSIQLDPVTDGLRVRAEVSAFRAGPVVLRTAQATIPAGVATPGQPLAINAVVAASDGRDVEILLDGSDRIPLTAAGHPTPSRRADRDHVPESSRP